MRTFAALLLVAALASAQGGRFREPEQTTQDLPVAVVATVVASDPATGTNEHPPVVTLEVTEVLKGDLKPGRIDAVWMPQGLYLQCGVGAEEITEEWNKEPCPGPEAGASLILGLQQDGAAWTALPDLRVPNTPDALERTRLEIRDPGKAKEARLDRETAAMVKDAGELGVVINAENLASVLRHVDRMGQVERLTFFEFIATTPEALARLAGLKTLESLAINGLDDAEIAAVATIGSLRSLRIYDPKVADDRSLLALAALEGLEELHLSAHIMPASRAAVVEELRGKMKGCRIR